MTKKLFFSLFVLGTLSFFGWMIPSSEAVSLPSIQLGIDDVDDPCL